MNYETGEANNIKDTTRIKKLCGGSRKLTKKDIEAVSYIVEKTTKISTVTFMLADSLEDTNEVRSELQRSAIRLVRDVSKSLNSLSDKDKFMSELLELVLLLEIAYRSGQLSRMNTELLATEITDLSEIIKYIDWSVSRKYLDDGMFSDEPSKDIFTPEPVLVRTRSYQRQEMDTGSYAKEHGGEQGVRLNYESQKDTVPKNKIKYKERVQEIQKDRRATILGLVQKKDRIIVKDVANIIKDCSEKTIQRELSALVKQGVLKKEGERRWSTYSLA